MLRKRRSVIHAMVAAVVMTLAGIGLTASPASAFTPFTNESWHWIAYSGAQTGTIDITWLSWNQVSTSGSLCITDTSANGKGVYVQLVGTYRINLNTVTSSTPRYTSGSGTNGKLCTNFIVPAPLTAPHDDILLRYVTVTMGNYWGTSSTSASTPDIIPNPYPMDTDQTTLANASVWTTFALRDDTYSGTSCFPLPSVSCGIARTTLHSGDHVDIVCQEIGSLVGPNPYWVKVRTWAAGYEDGGWLPSYYVNYAKHVIDLVPLC